MLRAVCLRLVSQRHIAIASKAPIGLNGARLHQQASEIVAAFKE